jgi:hypothetical protein
MSLEETRPQMKYVKLTVSLAAVGIIVVFSGFYVRTLDVGSCPIGYVPCYHTFPNTNIYVTPTGNTMIEVGIAFVLSSLVVFLLGQRNALEKYLTEKKERENFPKNLNLVKIRPAYLILGIIVFVIGVLVSGYSVCTFEIPFPNDIQMVEGCTSYFIPYGLAIMILGAGIIGYSLLAKRRVSRTVTTLKGINEL